MKLKNKKLYIIFTILLVIFSISIVDKTMQNDTFFTIPIAKDMIERGGLDGIDHLTQHKGLIFTHSGWIFDLVIYGVYNALGFLGIYILTIVITILISIVIFNTLLKEENNILLSFIITFLAIYVSNGVFAARGQIFSFLIFAIEMYAITGLVRTGKKRYVVTLLILPIILANTHDTVWPFYFVLFLPYIAEWIIDKIKLLNNDEPYKIIVKDIKCFHIMIIIMIISAITGLFTPVFGTAYINLFTVMQGVSKTFIAELQQVDILSTMPLFFIVTLIIGIIGFTRTKVELKDLLFVFGFLIMSLMADRNCYFLYLIGIISVCNIITEFLKTYEKDVSLENITNLIENNRIYMISLIILVFSISLAGFTTNIQKQYVDEVNYPVDAVEWMKKNIDIENMTIYNQFNYGSYLELNGIKVFIDSRSGIYCEEFSKNTNIMNDYLMIEDGDGNYKDVFEKYKITHVILKNESLINQYIYYDADYECIYQDDEFVLYEKKLDI